ncbi:MAG: DUF2723 domain-containing protein, partial [Saprospiraceae bacterium]
MLVNSFGLPFFSGLVPLFLLFGGGIWFGLRYAQRHRHGLLQRILVAFGVTVIAYMCYGTVVIRATANPPINMNDPSDPMRLLPYLNREQYGERPLVMGPSFDAQPVSVESDERYGRVGNKYAVVDEKVDYTYSPNDKGFFPRMGDGSQGRPKIYRQWIEKPAGTPTVGDNFEFFWKYQIDWMYIRYFMWNFSGRQNGEQGYYSWDPSSGNWITGISFIDEARLGKQSELPDFQKNTQANNKYYMIPLLLGLLGMFFHYFQSQTNTQNSNTFLRVGGILALLTLVLKALMNFGNFDAYFLLIALGGAAFLFFFMDAVKRSPEFASILVLFIITGLGIIVYSNEPPNEPRERDYVLAGSFFTFAIWVGLGVMALYKMFSEKLSLTGAAAPVSILLGLSAPLLMVTQNWDDHSRAHHYASRDYASNFLESCEPNAIIFTYGDNDTYPLWYCQEVEGIRTDVRVVNLSLIAVDWYIDQLRRTVNKSPAINMTIPQSQITGFKRVQIPYYSPQNIDREMTIQQVVKFLGEDHKMQSQGGRDFDTYLPTHKIAIPVNRTDAIASKAIMESDSNMIDTLHINLGEKKNYIIKDELAMLDILASNLWKRPIYWAVTCREDKLLGMESYLQLEGLGLRVVPFRNEGDQRNYGIIGCGRVATDIAFDNIMNKWKWGNFDKERLYVDRSYMPSLQTMRVTMIRIARQLTVEKKNDKAVALADKYFEAFPEYNFSYDQFSALMADVYARSGNNAKAAAKIREIAKTTEQQLRFVASQTPTFEKGYAQDQQYALSCAQTLLTTAANVMKDKA